VNYFPFHVGESLIQKNSRLRKERLIAARAIATHTKSDWDALVSSFGGRCVQCGCSDRKIEKDHIKPIYQGGSDGTGNLQPLCFVCNRAKGPSSFDWAEYRREHGFEEVAL